MIWWKVLLCILFGYLVGNINPSYIIGRLRGIDVRKKGSGNAGASNALILMGKAVGIGSALFDILKAAGVMWLAPVIFGDIPCIAEIGGVACTIGHIFPVVMKFKGGKGLACLGGMILAFDWRVLLIMLAVEIVVAIATDYICFVPLTASVIFPIVYGIIRQDVWGALMIATIIPLMFYKHKENLKRIKQKTEMPFSFLWNKEKALAKTNIPKE